VCNELKSQVFSQPRFADLTQTLIAVHLDGDSENAQTWAEKLKVSGYPTVLLFTANGQEIMRLGEALDMQEFEAALTAALSSGGSVQDAIANAQNGKATPAQWQMLATYQWGNGGDLPYTQAQQLQLLYQLTDLAPKGRERAMLAASTLSAAAEAAAEGDDEVKKAVALVKASAADLVERMLETRETIWATRATLTGGAEGILEWGFAGNSAVESATSRTVASKPILDQWLTASEILGDNPQSSADIRVESLLPAVTLEKMRLPTGGKISSELLARVRAAVRRADSGAKSKFERHAVISDAAELLAMAGDFEGARQLLISEIKNTDTPWYFQSSLSGICRDAGKISEALSWSEKARLSAKGRASRLQWISADLILIAKTSSSQQKAKLNEVAKDYYDTAFALNDGFRGRNKVRSTRVAAALKSALLHEPELRPIIAGYAAKCTAGGVDSGCAAHFGVLTGNAT